jgi:hypothetical protein
MKLSSLGFKLSVAGIVGVALFVLPAMSAPIAVSKDLLTVLPADEGQIVQVRAGRGGHHRGGSIHRGGSVHRTAAVRRGGAVYRGGAVVRRGAVVGGGYYGGGYCDPNYQYCGTGGYYGGGVYRGGAADEGATQWRC